MHAGTSSKRLLPLALFLLFLLTAGQRAPARAETALRFTEHLITDDIARCFSVDDGTR